MLSFLNASILVGAYFFSKTQELISLLKFLSELQPAVLSVQF